MLLNHFSTYPFPEREKIELNTDKGNVYHADSASTGNRCRVLFTYRTNKSMTGTSVRTPTVVTNTTGDVVPKSVMATATDSSKKSDAPMSAAGAAMACGCFSFLQM